VILPLEFALFMLTHANLVFPCNFQLFKFFTFKRHQLSPYTLTNEFIFTDHSGKSNKQGIYVTNDVNLSKWVVLGGTYDKKRPDQLCS